MTCYLDLDPNKRYILTPFAEIDTLYRYTQYPTARTIEVVVNDKISVPMPVGGIKPEGLWYAFGQSWIDYKLAWDKLEESFIFELSLDKSKILTLTNPQEINAFNDTYRVGVDGKIINWLDVSKHYDGIEIVPFNSDYSDCYWYQTFDVPSGCIWNLKAIVKTELVRRTI